MMSAHAICIDLLTHFEQHLLTHYKHYLDERVKST